MYSTYKKMIRKKVPVRQVYDARALRIIVDDEGGTRTSDAWAAAYRWASIGSSHAPHSDRLLRLSIAGILHSMQTSSLSTVVHC